ncbi:Thiosulfate sulfurtransferase GlpE [uncultured archaeon]|nr:Thiosulfate sulfurtransferase GlpE [uncultured archaeon]
MKTFFIIIFMTLILFPVLSGCVTKSPEKAQYTDTSVQQAKEMIDKGEVFILDVRTQEEYNAGHIRNSTLIPVQDLSKRLTEVPRDRKILVYCRTGGRSTAASEILVNNGFTRIYNMKGGITEWTKAGYEVVK